MTVAHCQGELWGRRGLLPRALMLAVSFGVLLAGCASGAQAPRQSDGAGAPATASAATPTKLLQFALTAPGEPRAGGIAYGGGGAGGPEPQYLLHAGLTYYDDQGVIQPRLAEQIPTIENGGWTVAPDGTMQLIWKLRSDVRWHDGTPLSAEDFVLGYQIGVDPELFNVGTKVLKQIAEVSAPDQQTLVMRWKNVYIYANALLMNTLVPLPRQRLAALYAAGDKQALANSSSWYEDWIGVGPYRMQQWVRGSSIEVAANDDYFLGRPKVDRVLFRYYGDVNALVVATLAGEVDVIPVGALKEDEAAVLKEQWEGAGKGTVVLSPNKLRHGQWQFRDPSALWLQDARLRQGLSRLIDRQSMVDAIQHGLSSPSDIPLPRQSPVYPMAQQQSLPAMAFDVTAAHRLLADAGLSRGPDGAYRTAGGAPLTFDLSATSDIASNVQEMLAVANQWQMNGVQPNPVVLTDPNLKDQLRSNLQGVNLTSTEISYLFFDNWVTSEISSEATKWKGGNAIGYSNPAFDGLYKRLYGSLNGAERDQIAAEMIKYTLDQQLYIPLSYSNDVSGYRKGIKGMTGVLPQQRVTNWNMTQWEVQ